MTAIHFNAAPKRKPLGNRPTEARDEPDADQDLFGYVFVMLAIGNAVGVIFVLKTLIYIFRLAH